MKISESENLLDELYNLVLKEELLDEEEKSSEIDRKRYVEITDILYKHNVEIPFGIEL